MKIASAALTLALVFAGAAHADSSDQPKPGAKACGGFGGATCSDTEWCEFPESAVCGVGDVQGRCMPRPEVCTKDYRPVCGCDGKTHGNACEAHAAGTDVASQGPCK